MVRYPLLIVSLLALAFAPAVMAVGEPWGCCVPDAGSCFDGSAYQSSGAFASACVAASGSVLGEGLAATCGAYEQWDLGCCCAGEDVFGSPAINSDEDILRTTRAACSAKTGGTWSFSIPQGGDTCVQTCGGETGTGTGGAFSVSGSAINATSGQPLADAGVFIPVPAGDISDTTGTDGAFTLTDVPAMSTRVFAVHPSCRPAQSQVILVDRDITDLAIAIDCTAQACQHQTPAITAPALVRGTDEVQFTASVQDTCRDLVQFEPQRCSSQYQDCVALPPQASPAIRDDGLQPQTTYCYKVLARFAGGSVTESPANACVTTGEAACMDREPDDPPQWCGKAGDTDAILSCTEQNRLQPQPCTGSTVCSSASGTPRCVEPPACSLCNGLAGLFSFLDLEIVDGLFTRACSETCVLDRQVAGNPTLVDAYSACTAYSSCTQYRSRAACETDRCGVGGDDPCAWTEVSAELGVGACANGDRPACDQCDDLFGACSRSLCEAIGPDCYYDVERNGLAEGLGCLSAEQMSCRRYDIAADCSGGVDAAFDIERDDAGAYAGGTNARVTQSQDRLGIGSCDWIGDRCIKDADEFIDDGEDDCIENGRFYDDPACLADATPPVTTFYLSDPPIYSRAAVRTLPLAVRDDASPVDLIRTFVCIGEASCVPLDTLGTLTLPEEGQHTLRFFSIDASGNHEEVQGMPIIIKDTHEPALEDVVLEEDR